MSVRHLLPIAATLLLASCAAAVTTTSTSTPSIAGTSGSADGGTAPSLSTSIPTPAAAVVPTADPSPVGASLASAQADFDCDGKVDRLQFFARLPGAPRDAIILARAVSDYTSDFQWDAVEDVHHWSTRSRLVLWSTSRSVIEVGVRYAMPADQERYWGLSCGSVKLAG